MNFLKNLLLDIFHRHKWEIIGKGDLSYTWEGRPYKTVTRYHLQCKVCGDLKYRELK